MEITPRQLELIEAASRLLTTSGVNGLTIKNLAKEMNFSESAIYRHFSSKEDIILAMLDYLAENIDEQLSTFPRQRILKIISEPCFRNNLSSSAEIHIM